MGIPVGKLSLYSACAGIHPTRCLPITIDVGTQNQALLEDPLYIGLRRERLRGEAYDELFEEFVTAVTEAFPRAVLQLEDFATHNAFGLLARYRDRICTFDDDIQGTAAVALAGLYSARRLTGRPLREDRFLFLGAGEAAIGMGSLLVAALQEEGLTEAEALGRCWFHDSRGLVVRSRTDLAPHKLRFAQDHAPLKGLKSAIDELRPTALIGASGVTASFNREVVEAMAELNERPIIFALSNPTSKAECTAEQAYRWSEGRVIFAGGSPFEPVEMDGRRFVPGQGNNVYIFPGIGLGVVVSGARHVTDDMFMAAARVLAESVSAADLESGRVYPPLEHVRQITADIAVAVARLAYRTGLADGTEPEDLESLVLAEMFEPDYPSYV